MIAQVLKMGLEGLVLKDMNVRKCIIAIYVGLYFP